MSGHTRERLVLTSQDDYPAGTANFESRYGVDAVVLYHDNAKADARRIVECWNQHDQLFATLTDMVALVEWAMSDEPEGPEPEDGAAVLERAKAAITACGVASLPPIHAAAEVTRDPDLPRLRENGAKAWAGVDPQELRDGTFDGGKG